MNMKQILIENLRFERRLTRETIAAMPENDLAFRPTAEQRSFGDQALHLISCQETLMDAFQGKGWQWDRGNTLEHYPTQASILAKLDAVYAIEQAYYENLESEEFFRPVSTTWGPPEPLIQLALSFLTHEAHHRGQMVAYLRMTGMTPPTY
jgi:uncharacterized damage-inducible protein DinB